ncbi:uncharacterized protein LOC105283050 isoform X2 [Ooceraea biroi]|nr:uncharacterized protein LOC105283050 isoform X2 [Ooceraea biroi]
MSRKYRYDHTEKSTSICNQLEVDETDLYLLIHPNEMNHPFKYYFLKDELMNLLERGHKEDWTDIYYSKKYLRHLKHCHARSIWAKFINRPLNQKFLLEEGATFIAHWCGPDVSYTHIETQLDNITQLVMDHLEIHCPTHPIFSVSQEEFSLWKHNNIYSDQWNYNDGIEILNILRKIFFTILNFHVLNINDPRLFPENILINYVLERRVGISASFAIIFHSVARRLGLYCAPIFILCDNSKKNCMLRWKPKYDPNIQETWFIIDILHNRVLKRPSMRFHVAKINSTELLLALMKYLKTTCKNPNGDKLIEFKKSECMELHFLVQPEHLGNFCSLQQHHERMNMSLATVVTTLQTITDTVGYNRNMRYFEALLEKLQNSEKKYQVNTHIEPKKRIAGMRFAIGMVVIMDHSRAQATGLCKIGVIIG